MDHNNGWKQFGEFCTTKPLWVPIYSVFFTQKAGVATLHLVYEVTVGLPECNINMVVRA